MPTATSVQPETLRTLPTDAARQVQWGFANRFDLQMLVQVGMANMRSIMPALQKAKAGVLTVDVRYLSVTPPTQQRQTRVVKDRSADEIAAELAEWIVQS